MATQLFVNNASATLSGSITDVQTSITLDTGQGSRFPSPTAGDWFLITLDDTLGNIEIAKCTTRSTDTLTIVRGQEGTTAQAFASGTTVETRVTKETLSALVQRDATETLTNKTINVDSNTISGIAATSFVLSNSSGNIDGGASQKTIPSGTVVGTSDTQTLTNKTIVAASNTITTAASGNLAATNLNAALSELQTDIDTRAVNSNFTAHTSATAAHGVTGNIVGTSDTQTLTNKTFDLSGNTLSGTIAQFNAALSDADFATLTGTETLTNKTIVAASNTITTAASGNLTSTSLNNALAELQGSIDVISNGGVSIWNTSNVGAGVDVPTSTTGSRSVVIGYQNVPSATSIQDSVLVGQQIDLINTTPLNNTCIGSYAAASSGNDSITAIGYYSLSLGGYNSVGVGVNAGMSSGGTLCTFIGSETNYYATPNGYSNSSCLGYRATVTNSNQVQLGDSSTTTYVYGTVQDRSDIRDKTDIKDTELGLSFIEKLRPVDFKWDYREDYKYIDEETKELISLPKDGSKKRNRYHHGLIAQEVKQVITDLGIDFGGYQDHSISGGQDVLSVGYGELIAPLIKAVQELSQRIKVLEGN